MIFSFFGAAQAFRIVYYKLRDGAGTNAVPYLVFFFFFYLIICHLAGKIPDSRFLVS